MIQGKIIIFDLDGVIIDSVDLMSALTRETFPEISHEEVKMLHRENIHEALHNTNWKRKIETEEEFSERLSLYAEKKLQAPLYPGMKDFLLSLSKKNTLVINTSAINSTCLPILESQGIRECFDFIATKEVHRSKIEKFKIIIEKYKKEPSELIFITDTVGDVKEAKEVGIPTIVVTWGLHQKEDFYDAPLDHILGFVDTPDDILLLIESR
jgi:phosphoglycolate phosphatase